MNKVFRNKNILLCGFLPNITTNEVDFIKYKEAKGLFIEDPWQRVKSIFTTDDMGDFHPELKRVMGVAEGGLFAGALYGGLSEGIKRTEAFVRRNDANIYSSEKVLLKVVKNENFVGIARGALRYGPRGGLFCGSFALITSCLEAYRNEQIIVDYTFAGFIVGALSKFSFGPKGMFSGGVIGGVLGTIYGGCVWAICKITKTDRLEMKYAHFAYTAHLNEKKKRIKRDPNDKSLDTLDDFEVIEDEISEKKEK